MIVPGTSEYVIQEVVGCGPFQVTIAILILFLGNSCTVFTMIFMAFGSYNPGWGCLHLNESSTNIRLSNVNATTTMGANETDPIYEYHVDNCPVFESCEDVVFNPDSSTIVSEWGLVCNHKWIPSIITSIQMVGVVVGSPIAGHLGDAVGRKTTLYVALLAMAVLNFTSIFSSSWQMFAVLRFFLGITCGFTGTIYYVFTAEFATTKWRSVLSSIPAWNVSTILFSLACMYLNDWRHVHFLTALIGLVGFIPVVWIPESPRFLEVKNRSEKFERAVRKIAKVNGKILPSMEVLGQKCIETSKGLKPGSDILEYEEIKGNSIEEMKCHEPDTQRNNDTYNISYLFRKRYRGLTLCISLPWFSVNLIYYAIGFGVKALHGNFYFNLMITSASAVPFCILPILLSNYMGRKVGSIILAAGTAVCLIGASCFEKLSSGDEQAIGVLILVSTAKVTVDAFWSVMMVYTIELYPTAVRGIATSWGNTAARTGGIIAPFLIPNDPNTVFISYSVMGLISLVCCGVMITLPETKGKPLK